MHTNETQCRVWCLESPFNCSFFVMLGHFGTEFVLFFFFFLVWIRLERKWIIYRRDNSSGHFELFLFLRYLGLHHRVSSYVFSLSFCDWWVSLFIAWVSTGWIVQSGCEAEGRVFCFCIFYIYRWGSQAIVFGLCMSSNWN